ncbi:hypothetical protein AAES_87418 [Amazona aestiva]|uniref:Uncharacterized protein n=1 Tax=Amazona aestiva TaxID=12930 RepID=A0A0Q3UTK2_AMAAE|nr:hypothetical protein AAES_87418 [Amazona aestiva]
MSGKAGRVVGKEAVERFRRCIGAIVIVNKIFAQLRTGEAVKFVTSQVHNELGEKQERNTDDGGKGRDEERKMGAKGKDIREESLCEKDKTGAVKGWNMIHIHGPDFRGWAEDVTTDKTISIAKGNGYPIGTENGACYLLAIATN